MSQENVEIVRRAFAAFEGGDLNRLSDLVTDDLIVCRAEPGGATSHGLAGFLQLTAEWTEGFRDWTPVPDGSPTWGNRSWCVFADRPRPRRAASLSRTTSGSSTKFRGARIARMSIYAREDEALESAGLSE
jgi:ketosteroid isomerase-like protein